MLIDSRESMMAAMKVKLSTAEERKGVQVVK